MFWSAALDLKTQRPSRSHVQSYGSFSRTASTTGFHIPQSIPEHQPVSQFTSPVPDQRRVEEYLEHPDTTSARSWASLQLSEHTQTALKRLLQTKHDEKPPLAFRNPIDSTSAPQASLKIAGHTPLLARAHGQDEPNPQENSMEHNYWMQELERRRFGLKRSRRRTCTPMSDRATTSPFKVVVIMCSVPLLLVLGFMVFVMLFGNGKDVVNVIKNVRDDDDNLYRNAPDIYRMPPEQIEKTSDDEIVSVQTRLRGFKENDK